MSGMINTGESNISGYGSRTIAIEVTGMCHQDVMRTSNYTVKVPYSRMSQTIQNINRMGGKVAHVSLGGNDAVANSAPSDTSTEEDKPSEKRKNRNRK